MAARYNAVRSRTYVALDVPDWATAERLVAALGPAVDGYKVGLELFCAAGAAGVEHLVKLGKRVFLDLKLHDIPNTVAGALRAVSGWGIEMVNVHASGGARMMEAARAAVGHAPGRPLLVAVTVLTSLDEAAAAAAGLAAPPAQLVPWLAQLAAACGLDGVVASGHEAAAIRKWAVPAFEVVVPGTRPEGSALGDQARVITPRMAMRAGATRLVLGRAVTQAPDPLLALQQVWEEMLQGLAERGNP
ncbi:MAG: orotidine-5'-phosphate decarboxylase [Alicyclobacillus sp.]|nr:orotidine-5'-phosphate decarboxylase [Alicyclobacillus sp.]